MRKLELLSEHIDKDGATVRVERDKVTGERVICREVFVSDCSVIFGGEESVYMCNKCCIRIKKPSSMYWKCAGKCKELGVDGK